MKPHAASLWTELQKTSVNSDLCSIYTYTETSFQEKISHYYVDMIVRTVFFNLKHTNCVDLFEPISIFTDASSSSNCVSSNIGQMAKNQLAKFQQAENGQSRRYI